jgi:hypothetical protein
MTMKKKREPDEPLLANQQAEQTPVHEHDEHGQAMPGMIR